MFFYFVFRIIILTQQSTNFFFWNKISNKVVYNCIERLWNVPVKIDLSLINNDPEGMYSVEKNFEKTWQDFIGVWLKPD